MHFSFILHCTDNCASKSACENGINSIRQTNHIFNWQLIHVVVLTNRNSLNNERQIYSEIRHHVGLHFDYKILWYVLYMFACLCHQMHIHILDLHLPYDWSKMSQWHMWYKTKGVGNFTNMKVNMKDNWLLEGDEG